MTRLHDLMEITLESMMVAERGEFLAKNPGNKGNGYRPGHSYGQGKKLEFRIPRDRYGNFHPQILAILRDQEEECDRLAGVLYTKGLTQGQAMIYTTNWIERLNRDFRRVTRMRTAMPNEESVLTLMGSVAMDHKAFDRALPNMTIDKKLFPD